MEPGEIKDLDLDEHTFNNWVENDLIEGVIEEKTEDVSPVESKKARKKVKTDENQ